MKLQQLWPEHAQASWPQGSISGLVLDSRQVSAGTVFFAVQGTAQAKHMADFIRAALQQGALMVFSERALPEFAAQPVVHVADVRQWIGVLAQRWLQAQAARPLPRIAAVTGTNGKTTVSRLLAEVLSAGAATSAVMGTTGNGILPHIQPATHTTLDAIQLQQQLYDFAGQGAHYVALEASSHGLDQGRLAGTGVEVAIFTNLSRDHLDYHGTLGHYAAAKARLFAFESVRVAVLNRDDAAYGIMLQAAQHNPARPVIWTYSLQHAQADFYVLQADYSLAGTRLQIQTPQGVLAVQSPLLGQFNVANLLATLAAAMAFGVSLDQLRAAIPQLQGAPGRMQVVPDQQRLFVVDYAHTPDALMQVLDGLRHHVGTSGQLWVVFGCGGERDRGKRPLMTQVALQRADQVILTADNPRHEPLQQILADMQAGLAPSPSLRVQPDRRLAIAMAVMQAKPHDVVVIAGKGHENYQEIDGVRHWFDDLVELKAALHSQHNGQYPALLGYPA